MELRRDADNDSLVLILEDRLDESIALDVSRPNLVRGLLEGLRPGHSLHDRITENYMLPKDYPMEVEITPREARRLGQNALRYSQKYAHENEKRAQRLKAVSGFVKNSSR